MENVFFHAFVYYISFPSAKDPDWPNRYPGKSTIDIITLLPYEGFKNWDGTRWMKRGEKYNTLKEKISKRLLEVLYKHIPQAKECTLRIAPRHFTQRARTSTSTTCL